ncbi:hypothetical protein SAMN05444395_103185 [Flavobacterium fryxellicola]|uniref:Peptidase E n=1 Tax=Flavobacterium fryxellicola TaxID=249352 RepID=A0A167X3J5_9FLAO|nr:DUF6702 family protein [Flavobacterium fryxellicola]OAB27997.1 hypothetical protein FBFR_09075 [Flavobacterium fryxellicola]SHN65010.1 hypothetical protein SAMN05444395_103185 [Flavobacterium fryxellicola]
MKKTILITFFGLLFLTLTSFSVHKFYVALYQVNYAPEKKMLQITARIFVDDLNTAIGKKYQKKINLGSEKETQEDLIFFKKYFSEKFYIKVNGQVKPTHFLSKEMEGDVLICYFSIKEIQKINSLEIYNAVITEGNSEQQNIMHFTVNGVKNTLLFTESTSKGVLKY